MNWIKILNAVKKVFLLYVFISTISLTLFWFSGSCSLHVWSIAFRVFCLLMLKIYTLLSILEGDSGGRHIKMDSIPLSSHTSRTNARVQAYKIQTSQTTKRPLHSLVNCIHAWMTGPGWTCWKESTRWCAIAWKLPHQCTFLGVGQEAYHRSLQANISTDFNWYN